MRPPHVTQPPGSYLRALFIAFFALTQLAGAVLPGETLSDKTLDERARALYREVRCVVCQNESIADSGADIAADMRRDIRAHISEGKTDSEIRDILRARYGDYVLFRPRFSLATGLLWGLPLAVLLAGGAIFIGIGRRKSADEAEPYTPALSAEEQARLDALLNRETDSHK
ncbi:cytochrome c-type biogenesis protein CcmH [Asticcacaulis sp. DW145]|uniref:cytochrome c-type biogenesis protein n=1 Tax=Asticcacaulis sp. DW145 TaxID=3095608 RepID=UPI003086509A|nr:cytochrome c-type biogenesis protein CcmH [Asticcacaulis sp. DW145]